MHAPVTTQLRRDHNLQELIEENDRLGQRIKDLGKNHLHKADAKIRFVSQPCLSKFLSAYSLSDGFSQCENSALFIKTCKISPFQNVALTYLQKQIAKLSSFFKIFSLFFFSFLKKFSTLRWSLCQGKKRLFTEYGGKCEEDCGLARSLTNQYCKQFRTQSFFSPQNLSDCERKKNGRGILNPKFVAITIQKFALKYDGEKMNFPFAESALIEPRTAIQYLNGDLSKAEMDVNASKARETK